MKQTWYQRFSSSITRASSSLVLVPFFSCNRRWQMVMRMLGMMQLSRGGEYISNIHLRLSNRVVYHVYTTRRPFDVSVSYGIYIYTYIYIYIYIYIYVYIQCKCCMESIARGMGSRISYSTRHSRVLYDASRPHPKCYIFQYIQHKQNRCFKWFIVVRINGCCQQR